MDDEPGHVNKINGRPMTDEEEALCGLHNRGAHVEDAHDVCPFCIWGWPIHRSPIEVLTFDKVKGVPFRSLGCEYNGELIRAITLTFENGYRVTIEAHAVEGKSWPALDIAEDTGPLVHPPRWD